MYAYCYEKLNRWFDIQNVKIFGCDYGDFIGTGESTCVVLIGRKRSFRDLVKSIILKVRGMW